MFGGMSFCASAVGACSIALLLSGCAQPPPPQQAVTAPTSTTQASVERLARLGGRRSATCKIVIATGDRFATKTSTMLVANDGGWCTIGDAYYQGAEPFRRFPPTRIDVTTAAAHGEVRIRRADVAYVDYRPAPGFKGADRFEYYSEPLRTTNAIEVTVE